MLPIPLKNSTGVNLLNPLRIYVSNEYSKEEAAAVENDLKALERLRTMALQARAATEASVATLLQYYAQVERLQGVFPIHPDGVRVAFTWHDAFRPTKKASEIDLVFEKSAVLFNVGAVRSCMAASADRTAPEGMKLACQQFQLAAGVFKHLREKVTPQLKCALQSEMTPEGLQMVEHIMLAQAQACFYEKAVADRAKSASMKASVIARLASQAADMYKSALTFADSQAMEAAGLDKSWPTTLKFQQDFYTAAAQYFQSEAVKEAALASGSGYGEEVTRLRAAQRLIEAVLDTAQRLRMGPAIIGKAELLKAKIVKNRATAEKDNSTIYLEPIPAEMTLKPVATACMVKVIDTEFPAPQQKLFPSLLPKQVREALTAFAKEAGEVVAAAESEGREASKEARQQLSSVGLPGSLEAHQSPAGLPESTWRKLQDLRAKESGVAELQAKALELQGAAGKVADVFLRIENTLREEEARESAFQATYGEQWTRLGLSSSRVINDTWEEVRRFQQVFATAQKSDEYLQSRLNAPEMEELSGLLAASRADLDRRLAKPDGSGSAVVVDTKALSKAMLDLALLLDERDALLKRMRAEQDVQAEVLKAKLLAGEATDKASAAVLAALGQVKEEVAASIKRQAPVLAQILQENETFQNARRADPAVLERDALIQRLETGVVACHELHAQLSEGLEFYASVGKRIGQLMLVVEDMAYTQDLQRRDFEVELGQAQRRQSQETEDAEVARRLFDQLNTQAGGAAPGQHPPGPPPPYSAAAPPAYQPPASVMMTPPMPSPPPEYSAGVPSPPYAMPPPAPTAAAMPISQPVGNDVLISQIVGMGFSAQQARQALDQHNNDLQAALNALLG